MIRYSPLIFGVCIYTTIHSVLDCFQFAAERDLQQLVFGHCRSVRHKVTRPLPSNIWVQHLHNYTECIGLLKCIHFQNVNSSSSFLVIVGQSGTRSHVLTPLTVSFWAGGKRLPDAFLRLSFSAAVSLFSPPLSLYPLLMFTRGRVITMHEPIRRFRDPSGAPQ